VRITRETLLRIARETTAQRTHSDKSILAVYLTGSLLTDDPLLGGVADIDLVFIHDRQPPARREIVPLTPEVHIDIQHNPRSDYESPRRVRFHPWLGPEMWDPMLLHETGSFFEFVQAGVRDKFNDPLNRLQRSRTDLEHARQIWSGLPAETNEGPARLLAFFKAVSHAANAVAILNGTALAERRFLLQFPARAEAAGRPGLTGLLFRMLGAETVDDGAMTGFLAQWEKAFLSAGSRRGADARLHPSRLGYYRQALQALLDAGQSRSSLWPLLQTWTLSAMALPVAKQGGWQAACKFFALDSEGLPPRLAELDQFMDEVDLLLEDLAGAHGLDAIYRDGRKVP